MKRQRRASIAIAVAATALSLLVAEGALRALNRGPWRPFEDLAHVPRMTQQHTDLGWVNQPGTYRYRVSPSQAPITITLDDRGQRANHSSGDRTITVYGGSFTMGFALDDGQDYPCKLGELLPNTAVHNAGVPGYGTVQSRRLHLEHTRDGPVSDVIVYGLVDYHDARNAGTWAWLHALERAGGHHPWVGVPWAWWDGSQLHSMPPRTYHHWAASEWSALVQLAEFAVIDVHDRLHRTKTETTVQTISRWRDEAGEARFVVAILYAPTRHKAYRKRLAEEGIEVVDLRHTDYPAAAIPGDGHPDASVHARWAHGLAEVLQ